MTRENGDGRALKGPSSPGCCCEGALAATPSCGGVTVLTTVTAHAEGSKITLSKTKAISIITGSLHF